MTDQTVKSLSVQDGECMEQYKNNVKCDSQTMNGDSSAGSPDRARSSKNSPVNHGHELPDQLVALPGYLVNLESPIKSIPKNVLSEEDITFLKTTSNIPRDVPDDIVAGSGMGGATDDDVVNLCTPLSPVFENTLVQNKSVTNIVMTTVNVATTMSPVTTCFVNDVATFTSAATSDTCTLKKKLNDGEIDCCREEKPDVDGCEESNEDAHANKVRRKRTKFSQEEKDLLESFYLDSVVNSKKRKTSEIQNVLKLDKQTITAWFRNRHCKQKKDELQINLEKANSVAKELNESLRLHDSAADHGVHTAGITSDLTVESMNYGKKLPTVTDQLLRELSSRVLDAGGCMSDITFSENQEWCDNDEASTHDDETSEYDDDSTYSENEALFSKTSVNDETDHEGTICDSEDNECPVSVNSPVRPCKVDELIDANNFDGVYHKQNNTIHASTQSEAFADTCLNNPADSPSKISLFHSDSPPMPLLVQAPTKCVLPERPFQDNAPSDCKPPLLFRAPVAHAQLSEISELTPPSHNENLIEMDFRNSLENGNWKL